MTGGLWTTAKVMSYKIWISNSPSFPHLKHHWTTGSFCCAHPSVTQSPSPPSQALFFFDFRDLGKLTTPSLDRGVAQTPPGNSRRLTNRQPPEKKKKKTLLQDATLPCHNPSDTRFKKKERRRRWLVVNCLTGLGELLGRVGRIWSHFVCGWFWSWVGIWYSI